MSISNAVCHKCGCMFALEGTNSACVCPHCGEVLDVRTAIEYHKAVEAVNGDVNAAQHDVEAEDMFLRGSSYLAIGDFVNAGGCFLDAAKKSPSVARYWMYLLCAVTEQFKKLMLVAGKNGVRKAGERKVICYNVYKNFISTAKPEDFAAAYNEMGIDLTPKNFWSKIIHEVLSAEDGNVNASETAECVEFAYKQLKALGFDITDDARDELDTKLNPVKDGIAEINTLMFAPKTENGMYSVENAETVEFARDNMEGSKRFSCFLLTKNVKSIGSNFPFARMRIALDVTEIPSKLMYCAEKLEKVTFSPSVRRIGERAFFGCVNLKKVRLNEGLVEIGDQAFFDTQLRCAVLPNSLKRIGHLPFGVTLKDDTDIDISKYVYIIPKEACASSDDWNLIGYQRAGYVLRTRDTLSLIYPTKYRRKSNGLLKAVPLSDSEIMIFKALVCNYADFLPGDFKSNIFSKISRFFRKSR